MRLPLQSKLLKTPRRGLVAGIPILLLRIPILLLLMAPSEVVLAGIIRAIIRRATGKVIEIRVLLEDMGVTETTPSRLEVLTRNSTNSPLLPLPRTVCTVHLT
jgi:hypothetical protein